MFSSKRARNIFVITIGLLLISILVIFSLYIKIYKTNSPEKLASNEINDVVAKVSKIIILPEGEEPTIATVLDLEKVKDQPFFANAKIGDKVLIYLKAKKAFLYDPIANKIVEATYLSDQDLEPFSVNI